MSAQLPGAEEAPVRLSICMATRNRGGFIGETLDSILGQLEPGVEVVIVDGASTDETPQVLASYCARFPQIRCRREAENSGVDADYDKALNYAGGEYCWLMTDDDLMQPGAIGRVLRAMRRHPDVIIVDAEVRTIDFAKTLGRRLPGLPNEREYSSAEAEAMFRDVAAHLTFIGAVIVRRDWWLARERARYYGSLFIHVGVIFQHPPANKVIVIAEPLITIRYGNAMWTPRRFEIWTFKWPELIWSFEDYSDAAKATILPREPWRRFRTLLLHRGLGGYSIDEYRRFLADRGSRRERLQAIAVALIPGALANAVVAAYIAWRRRTATVEMHDLLASRHASFISRLMARRLGL